MFSLFDFAIAYGVFLVAVMVWVLGAAGRGAVRRGGGQVRARGRAAIDSAPRRF